MLKKTDVYDFIDKVQTKAVNSVNEKYEIAINQAIDSFLNDPVNSVLKKAIHETDYYSKKAVEAQEMVKKHTGRIDCLVNETDMRATLFGSWRQSPSEEVNQLKAELASQIYKVEEEYRKIKRMCQKKKTGDQARTALIALEFDVTWLNNLENLPAVINEAEFKIDKSLVFPCGEQGL